MNNKNRSSASGRPRNRLLLLSGGFLLALGGVLLLTGGLQLYGKTSVADEYLGQLQKKAASIPLPEESDAYSLTQPYLMQSDESTRPSEPYSISIVDSPPAANVPGISATNYAPTSDVGGSILSIPLLDTSVPETSGISAPNASSQVPVSATQNATAPQGVTVANVPFLPGGFSDASTQAVSTVYLQVDQQDFALIPMDLASLPPMGSLPPATKIRIPAIALEASVESLALQRAEGLWYFPNPNQNVGQLSSAGNPGERGRAWYFGHLQRSFRGAVFESLPKVVDVLAKGETVDVILETAHAAYLYRVTGKPIILSSRQFHYDYFPQNLYSGKPEIVLVTCVPPLKWDYRLVVIASLVGVAALP